MNDTTATPVTIAGYNDEANGPTVEAVQAKFDALQSDFRSLSLRYRELVISRDEWRDRVRDAIIGYSRSENLCTEGTNDFLNELGLDPMEADYVVRWTETYTVTVERSGTVTATDEDEARDLVEDDTDQADSDDNISDLVEEMVNQGGYESDDEGIRITEVELA